MAEHIPGYDQWKTASPDDDQPLFEEAAESIRGGIGEVIDTLTDLNWDYEQICDSPSEAIEEAIRALRVEWKPNLEIRGKSVDYSKPRPDELMEDDMELME